MRFFISGTKLKCPFCERTYGYETNLRAHIRQRHQGIRVPCPYCHRTFTRNNTVRRHIAREHRHHVNPKLIPTKFGQTKVLPDQPYLDTMNALHNSVSGGGGLPPSSSPQPWHSSAPLDCTTTTRTSAVTPAVAAGAVVIGNGRNATPPTTPLTIGGNGVTSTPSPWEREAPSSSMNWARVWWLPPAVTATKQPLLIQQLPEPPSIPSFVAAFQPLKFTNIQPLPVPGGLMLPARPGHGWRLEGSSGGGQDMFLKMILNNQSWR